MSPSPLIAVVDDDPAVRGSLDSLLRSAGMTPRCFASGAELLDAGLDGFACVVTDLHMPGMNGLQLLASFRRAGRNVPFILVTAFPTDTVREQARNGGVTAFLVKPVDPDEMLDAIDLATIA